MENEKLADHNSSNKHSDTENKAKQFNTGVIIALAVLPFILLFFSLRSNNEETSSPAPQAKLETKSPSYDELLGKGIELYNKQNPKEALEYFVKASQLQPNNAILLNNICASYNGINNFTEAITYCEKALALDPNFELARNNLLFAKSNLSK